MFNSKIATGLCFSLVVVLGACAQQPEPLRITPQPIYNKHGDVVGCEGGGQYDSTSQQENPCEPPETGCEYIPGSNYPCLPPEQDCDPQSNNGHCYGVPDDKDNDPDPQQPTGPTGPTGPIN